MAGRFANTQIMADPRIQQESQLIQGPLPKPSQENVAPIDVRITNSPMDNPVNKWIVEAYYQRKKSNPSKKVSNKELVEAVKQDGDKKAIISEAKGNPVDSPKKDDFKAKAKKSVRDWTDNSGMQYIANVNPYAAAGMGFANQMANPFKQKYFEDRADANEEEDARRLNYEIGRQAKLDRVDEEERKRQREIEDYIPSVEAPSTLGVRGVDIDGFNKDIADILARTDISNPVKRQMIAERVAKIKKEIAGAERGFNFKGVGPIAPSQNRWATGFRRMGLWKSAAGDENESLERQMPGARVLQFTPSQEKLFLKNNPGLLEAVNNIKSSTGAYARIVQKADGRIVIGMFDPEKNSFIRIFDPQEMRSEKGLGMQEDRTIQRLLDE